MPTVRFSRVAYRLLLRTYPRDFRERFAADLEADFAELLATRGRLHAWRRALSDIRRAVPLTTADAMAERARLARLAGPIIPPGEPAMRSLLFDLRHGIRSLRRAPAFTAITILTLALGIGANSAIFSLVNAVLLRPLGYPQPERLMLVHEAIPESGLERFDVSPADYLDLLRYQQAFSAIGAYRTRPLELSASGEAEQIPAAEMSASVFPILGIAAAQGRTFLPEEDQRESRVAVISHGLWMRKFGARAVLGQAMVLDRTPYTIVGVMPSTFEFPRRGASSNAEPAEVWLPLVFNPFERQARGMFYNHTVVGRLRDGMTADQAGADIAALAGRIHENYPVVLRKAFTLKVGIRPFADEVAGPVRRPLLILLAAVGLVLLVACANVANLILSRSVSRQREIGVRAALGAGRLRLFQVLLGEALILALCGGALGLVLGFWAVRAVPAVLAASIPAASNVALDWRVVAFTGMLSLGCAAAFALVPLGAGLRRDLNALLRDTAGRVTAGRHQHRLQRGLVIVSVALAFVLLVSAGLLVRSFTNLMAIDSGVGASHVLSMQVRLPPAGFRDAARIRSFYTRLGEQLRSLPGVRSAALASDLPLEADGERRAFTPEHSTATGISQTLAVTWIHGDYFGTFGVRLVKGRVFTADEHRENRGVAIVSQRLAETHWRGEDPIGKRLKWGLRESTSPWVTVVGIAADVVDGPPGSEPVIHAYVPYSEIPDAGLAAPLAGLWRRYVIALRSDADPRALISSARAAVASLDPALAVSHVQTLGQLERDRLAPRRFSVFVLSGFGAGALLLAAIGLYGVLAFGVSQRRREIGVRIALGSPRQEVVRLIVLEGMALVSVGLAVGAAGAAMATRVLKTLLFETGTHDPLTFVAVPILLAAVALIACYLPARRAADVDPMVALRQE